MKGFCPSFVTVHGAKPRSKPAGVPVATDAAPDAGIPEPTIPAIDGTTT